MLLKSIARKYDVSVVRARSALRAGVFHFAVVGGVTGLKSATNALYLARRDPTDLPWLYLGTAAIVALVTFYLGKRLAVTSAKVVLRNALLACAMLLFLFAALAAFDVRASLGVLYVLGEAFATGLNILFWARLGEVFDVRAGKRVFGAIAAAGMGGAVAGGLAVTALAGADVPSVAWCFIAPAILLATRPLLGAGRTPGSIRRERVAFADGLKYAVGRSYPAAVAVLVLLFAVQTAAIDYVFRTGTYRFEAGKENEMAALFGVLNAVAGVLAIAFQTTLTARLLSRIGVFTYLGIVPAFSIPASLWAFAAPHVFAPLFVLKTLEMMGSYSLYQPGLQLLYNPMPPALRGSMRAVIDGAVKKLGGAVGGIVLLLVGGVLVQQDMLALVIALASGLIFWIYLLRPQYLRALETKLGDRGVLPIPVIDPSDHSTRAHLVKALQDPDATRTLAAISVLESDPKFDFRPHIQTLISHPGEAVRLSAIGLIEKTLDQAYVPYLAAVIRSPARHPKAQAARALVMIDPVTAREVLEPILLSRDESSDRGLLGAAICALLAGTRGEPMGEGGVTAAARDLLLRMFESAPGRPPAERRDLARLVGRLGPGPYARYLAPFIDDPNATVRRAAIEAAGHARDPSLPPLLIKRLSDRPMQRVLRTALAAYGDEVIETLARFLDDRRIEVAARVHVPAILRMIGTRQAADAMLFSNRQDDAYLRYVIIEELGRMRRRDPGLAFNVEQTKGAIMRRLNAYTHYRPIAADLAAGGPPFELLHRTARDRVNQNLQAALRLLGLLYDQKAMETAFHGFIRGDRASHADAVELVDVALTGADLRAEVLAQVEPGAPAGVESRSRDRARALCEGRDVLLAMIAWITLHRIGEAPPDVREPTLGEPIMPRPIVERVFLLQKVQFFRGLAVDDLAAVAQICTEGHSEAGEFIYQEGEGGDSMYVIISGDIHLLHEGQPLLDLHAGDSFGQTSILDGGKRPVTAKAGDEGVDFMRLERQPLLDLMADRPELVSGMLVELGARIRELIHLSGHAGAHAMTTAERSEPAPVAHPEPTTP